MCFRNAPALSGHHQHLLCASVAACRFFLIIKMNSPFRGFIHPCRFRCDKLLRIVVAGPGIASTAPGSVLKVIE